MWRRAVGREREEERGRGGSRQRSKYGKERASLGALQPRPGVQVPSSLSRDGEAARGPSRGDLRGLTRVPPSTAWGPQGPWAGLDPSEAHQQGKGRGAWRLPEGWRAGLRPQRPWPPRPRSSHTLEHMQLKPHPLQCHQLQPKREEPKSPRRSPKATATIDCA